MVMVIRVVELRIEVAMTVVVQCYCGKQYFLSIGKNN
jgi:hypothetical protein